MGHRWRYCLISESILISIQVLAKDIEAFVGVGIICVCDRKKHGGFRGPAALK